MGRLEEDEGQPRTESFDMISFGGTSCRAGQDREEEELELEDELSES